MLIRAKTEIKRSSVFLKAELKLSLDILESLIKRKNKFLKVFSVFVFLIGDTIDILELLMKIKYKNQKVFYVFKGSFLSNLVGIRHCFLISLRR